MARGANTDTMTAIQITDWMTGLATDPPSINPRVASITDVTGLALTNACSHPGMVPVGANAELAKVSGRRSMKPQVFTDSLERAVMPTKAIGQHMVNPNAVTRANAPNAPAAP